MNDKTRLRIKVPAHLYESVKKQLALKEGKGNHSGGVYTQVVKEKKTSTPSSGGSFKKSPKMEAKPEGEEKTVEERLSELEEIVKKMQEGKSSKEEETEEDGKMKKEEKKDTETEQDEE